MTRPRSRLTRRDGAAVRLEGVTQGVRRRARVLDDVSFEVPAGCGFVILGRSGTGKSVTLRHIIGLVQPDRGRVFVERRRDQRARRAGAVARPPEDRLSLSERRAVRLDLASARTSRSRCGGTPSCRDREIRERAAEKLDAVGLEARIRQDAGRALRRDAQARRPRARAGARSAVLLVDEPSAGLDPITADEIDDAAARPEAARRRHADRRHAQHPEREAARRRAASMLHEGRIVAQRHAGGSRAQRRSDGPGVHVVAACRVRRPMAKGATRGRRRVRDRRPAAVRRRPVPHRRPPHAVQRHVRGLRRVQAARGARQRRQGAGRGHGRRRGRGDPGADRAVGPVPREDAGPERSPAADPRRLGRARFRTTAWSATSSCRFRPAPTRRRRSRTRARSRAASRSTSPT